MTEMWTASGFVADVVATHKMMANRSFSFVLGAGASVTSGIPTGAQLAKAWLHELQTLLSPTAKSDSMSAWATAENLEIQGFNFAKVAEFYPEVFLRRFRNDPEQGYAYLENAMEGAEPSYGYSVLARLLSETRHRVVISTNFDNLVADAIAIYGSKYPLIAGHESLTGFVSSQPRRPLVAKIHRDLFFEPKNDPEGVARLPDSWHGALRRIMQFYTPIFIGYGGNDGSLMGFLESLTPADVIGRPRWCFRESDGIPSDRIRRVVGKLGGVLVPIPGFDELMLMLGNAFDYGLRHRYVLEKAELRATLLLSQFERLQASVSADSGRPDARGTDNISTPYKAAQETAQREEGTTGWYLHIRQQQDPKKKISLARQALETYPDDPRLLLAAAEALVRQESPSSQELAEGRRLATRLLELPDFPYPESFRGGITWLFLDDAESAVLAYEDAENAGRLELFDYVNYAEVLIVTGRHERAQRILQGVLPEVRFTEAGPATAFLLVVLSLLTGNIDTNALTVLHRALISGVRSERYTAQNFLPHLERSLETEDFEFMQELSYAISHKNADLSTLEKFSHWHSISLSEDAANGPQ